MESDSRWAAIYLLLLPLTCCGAPSGSAMSEAEAINEMRLSATVVSIRELTHRVSREAKKEFDKGCALFHKGDAGSALAHFQKAAESDPQLAGAFNGVGVAEMGLGRFREAAGEFQHALELVPDNVLALANLSIVLYELKEYDRAVVVSRQAIRFNPLLSSIRYILALSLMKRGSDRGDELQQLQRVASDLPKAHLLAAKILAELGKRDDAVQHIGKYLGSFPADGSERQQLEDWVEELQR